MTDTKKSSSSKLLLIMLAVFVLPVLLAKFALDFDWFNKASTNRGELLSPTLDMSSLLNDVEPSWRVLYILPDQCDDRCENALYSVAQIWLALGKETDRVTPNVLLTESSDAEKAASLKSHQTLKLLNTDRQNVKKVFKDVATDGIFLVDTLGNVILRYPIQAEQQQAVMQSRDILADLKKLLKLSRIG